MSISSLSHFSSLRFCLPDRTVIGLVRFARVQEVWSQFSDQDLFSNGTQIKLDFASHTSIDHVNYY